MNRESIEELDLSVQAYHYFKRLGVNTVDQLRQTIQLSDVSRSPSDKNIIEAMEKLKSAPQKPPEIEIDSDAFGLILNCAVRYALGRRTFVTASVPMFITPLLPFINNGTLYVLDQDITDQKYYGGYGDECDHASWMQFHEKVKAEEENRGMEPYKSFREVDMTR